MNTLETLVDLIDRHTQRDGSHISPVPGLKLLRASSPSMSMPVIYEPTLCLIVQGVKQVCLGTKTFQYDTGNYLIASVELPVVGTVIEASSTEPYLCLQLDLDKRVLSDLAVRYPDHSIKAFASPTGLALNRTTAALHNAAVRLAALLDTPEDIDALAPLIIQEILYRLLTEPGSSLIRKMAQADSRLNQIARTIRWMRDHFHEPCRIEHAAKIAGMSRSTFHLHFKAITTMSPIEFRTHLRMHEARRLMVSDGLDAASAGFRVGYESPSQFSRDYVRLFGLPPTKHTGQLRELFNAAR
ncbi:AraC family transcriptional regulator [Gilvimarinus sp. 1_MG-2023]|uniref:AraC family transcriptional regulator n=1 Tax=Gilvimarinus sp. 1_MG-2023 TaxID=3062638 RepID=UPI0026E2F2D2|nr:AraC family transcriptional regulator [Gilvimarinus sp. 1_MG-2023]MDO6747569.1 AraC family transcriptional regulator [Gilvimarinus sp. 1_MG-2023]